MESYDQNMKLNKLIRLQYIFTEAFSSKLHILFQ